MPLRRRSARFQFAADFGVACLIERIAVQGHGREQQAQAGRPANMICSHIRAGLEFSTPSPGSNPANCRPAKVRTETA